MSIPLIDTHLDLSWNALAWDRDLTQPIEAIRDAERDLSDDDARGHATVSLSELRRGNIGLVLGTLLARALPRPELPTPKPVNLGMSNQATKQKRLTGTPRRIDIDHRAATHTFAVAQGQLAYYRLLEQQGRVRLIRSRRELDDHWPRWLDDPQGTPIGLIVAMEGADPILHPDQAEAWFAQGLRAVGPVHYGQNGYAVGTGFDGPLTAAGRDLLRQFDRLGIILDVTHLSDMSMAEALDVFDGVVMASHHNCRALVPHHRQLSDDQIRRLIERDAVIGTALDAWMLYPGWKIGQTQPDVVGLDAVADHIDHVCQLAGDVKHAAIGSDLDGGFGREQTVRDLDTIADLQKLAPILRDRGYSDDDVAAIFHGNWLRLLRRGLPAG